MMQNALVLFINNYDIYVNICYFNNNIKRKYIPHIIFCVLRNLFKIRINS